MKKVITFFFAAFLLAGCKSSYDVTLTNGLRFTGVTKPKLNREQGTYVFKNAAGRVYQIPETRIRVIEPHVNVKETQFRNSNDGSKFNPSAK